jgi:hypothetical protein
VSAGAVVLDRPPVHYCLQVHTTCKSSGPYKDDICAAAKARATDLCPSPNVQPLTPHTGMRAPRVVPACQRC